MRDKTLQFMCKHEDVYLEKSHIHEHTCRVEDVTGKDTILLL